MFRRSRAELLSVAILPLGLGFAAHHARELLSTEAQAYVAQAGPVSYARQVAPLLEARCAECHGATTKEAGLDITTYEALMKGSRYGTVIEAGDPAGSLLMEMVVAGEMPQDAPAMPADEIAILRSWIAAGAQNN
jgi:mono/diheme cytochrome c family protein